MHWQLKRGIELSIIWLLTNGFCSGQQIFEQTRSRDLPCLGESDCVVGKKDVSYVISALHDPTVKQIAVFGDFETTLFKGDSINVTCKFWLQSPEGEPDTIEVADYSQIFDDELKYSPFVVKCPDPLIKLKQVPKWVSIAINETDTGAKSPIEQIALSKMADVGACLAPVYTPDFEMLNEWLSHYTALGVEGYHIYWTTSLVSWNRSSNVEPDSFKPFAHPQITWYHYNHFPLEERYYYSQQTVYNDCVFRNRHSYEYMLMFDHDEFLIIKEDRFSGMGPLKSNPLINALRHLFPPKHAALGIFRYAYRNDCQKEAIHLEPGQSFHEAYTHRLTQSESVSVLNSGHYGDKLIIKPLMVDIFYMHFLASARPGFVAQSVNAQASSLYLKHLRTYGHDCSELVAEDPYDQP